MEAQQRSVCPVCGYKLPHFIRKGSDILRISQPGSEIFRILRKTACGSCNAGQEALFMGLGSKILLEIPYTFSKPLPFITGCFRQFHVCGIVTIAQ